MTDRKQQAPAGTAYPDTTIGHYASKDTKTRYGNTTPY